MRRRVEIKPDHVTIFGGKGRVLRQLETLNPVRLQAVRRPDPLHRTQRDASGLGHRPAGPVRCLTRRLGEGQFDHTRDLRRRQWRQAGLSGLVVQQASNALAHEPLLPAPHSGLETPAQRMISAVPQPSAAARMIRARQTCFCGLLRSATTAANRSRSAVLTSMLIPSRISHHDTQCAQHGILSLRQTTRTTSLPGASGCQ